MFVERFIQPFLPRSQPWITRQSYSHELGNFLSFPVAIALVEGGVVGVLAEKAFDVTPMMFAMIMASPMFANLTSFLWARLARGRPKVHAANLCQLGMLLAIAAIALLPTDGAGPYLLVALVVLARCFNVGIITLRSTIWRMNYPRHVRAQVTGRLVLINSIILALAPLIGYAVIDAHEQAFRLVYPASMIFGLIGVWSLSGVRLRGERELLRYEREPDVTPLPHGEAAPIYEYDPQADPTRNNGKRPNFWSVLKQDQFFRRYMFWQFVAGCSNMAGEVAVIYAISRATTGLPLEYALSILLSTAIPMLVATLTLPYWAKRLDNMHVVQFRVRQGRFWITNQALNWVGAGLIAAGMLAFALPVLFVARFIQGIARGAGMLAWNLGHNDFADRRMVALYMGIHMTLTGLRGVIAPFLGILLFAGWSPLHWPGTDQTIIPGFEGIGFHVFLITTALAVASEIGFRKLYARIRREGADNTIND